MKKSRTYNKMIIGALIILLAAIAVGIMNAPGVCAALLSMSFVVWFAAVNLPEHEKYEECQ
jgi:hypothetical protein